MADFSSGFMGGMQQLQQIDAGNLANRQAQQNMQYLAQSHAQEMANQQAQAQVMQQLSQQQQQKQQQAQVQGQQRQQQDQQAQQQQFITGNAAIAPDSQVSMLFEGASRLDLEGKSVAANAMRTQAGALWEKMARASKEQMETEGQRIKQQGELIYSVTDRARTYPDTREGYAQWFQQNVAPDQRIPNDVKRFIAHTAQNWQPGMADEVTKQFQTAHDREVNLLKEKEDAQKATMENARTKIQQQKANADTVKANAYKEHVDFLKKAGTDSETGLLRPKAASAGSMNAFAARQDKALSPITKAQEQAQVIRGLIATDDPASLPQIQKILANYAQPGRITNQLITASKGFGDVYERGINAISRWTTGDYTVKNKKMILDLVNQMDKTVFDPARKRVVEKFKKQAVLEGIDPSFADSDSEHADSPLPSTGSPQAIADKKGAPADAIQYLKSNPALKEEFKAKYGYLPEGK